MRPNLPIKLHNLIVSMPLGQVITDINRCIPNNFGLSQPACLNMDLGSQFGIYYLSYDFRLIQIARYLSKQLGLETQQNTTLHEFENALSSMVALIYWGGMHILFAGS